MDWCLEGVLAWSGFANDLCSNMIWVEGVLGMYAQHLFSSLLEVFDVLLKTPWLDLGLFDNEIYIDAMQKSLIREPDSRGCLPDIPILFWLVDSTLCTNIICINVLCRWNVIISLATICRCHITHINDPQNYASVLAEMPGSDSSLLDPSDSSNNCRSGRLIARSSMWSYNLH